MNAAKDAPVKSARKLSFARIPLLLLICGLGNYALLRGLAPAVDPENFNNLIGLAAVLETGAIEITWRRWQRKQKANPDES